MKNAFYLLILVISMSLACNKEDVLPDQPQFSKLYGGSDGEGGYFITKSTEGGYVLATSSSSNNGDVSGNHGSSDFWVVSVDRNGNKLWQKTLGGSKSDVVSSIVKSTDGGYVVAGYAESNDGDVTGTHGSEGFFFDAWVVKLDKNGNKLWQKTLGGSSIDNALSLVRSPDGGYLIAGYTSSNDGDVSGNHGITSDAWIVKLDEGGSIVWQKTYGGTNHDLAYSIVATPDGGYLVTGQTQSNNGDVSGNHGSVDAWLFQIDGSGNLLWEKTYGGTNADYGRSVTIDSDGDYVLAGLTSSNDGDVSGSHGGFSDAWVVKVDRRGNKLWQKALGGSGIDDALSIVSIANLGYVFAGGSSSNNGDVSGNHGSGDAWIVTLDKSGNILGQKSIGGSGVDLAGCLVATSGRNYVFSGYSSSNDGDVSGNHGSVDAWIFSGKLD